MPNISGGQVLPTSQVGRARRTQAERRSATRAALLEAAIGLVIKRGNADVRLAEVASEAGVTKGAVQHHFATKTALLAAVVDDGWSHLVDRLRRYEPTDAPLEDQVTGLVQLMWESYSRPAAMAAYIIASTEQDDAELRRRHRDAFGAAAEVLDHQWASCLAGSGVGPEQVRDARHFARTHITGMLAHRQVDPDSRQHEVDLSMLRRGLLAIVEPVTSPAAERATGR